MRRRRFPSDSEIGRQVRLVVFDFDGVFTDNTVWTRRDRKRVGALLAG